MSPRSKVHYIDKKKKNSRRFLQHVSNFTGDSFLLKTIERVFLEAENYLSFSKTL